MCQKAMCQKEIDKELNSIQQEKIVPCEYLTYGSRCSLRLYLVQETLKSLVETCPQHKPTLLAGNECYHLDKIKH